MVKLKFIISVLMLLMGSNGLSQEATPKQTNISISPFIDGSLLTPDATSKVPLVIIIGDYGPTDRNGNQNFQKNYILKKLAYGLAEHKIASFRYDKRIVKQLKKGRINARMSFNDFIKDAADVINHFSNQDAYQAIYVIGHGQGSLVGMLAISKTKTVSGFISLAGAAKSIDQVILEQVEQTAPNLISDTQRVLNTLKTGKTTTNFPRELSSVFNLETQDFLASWMAYTPTEVIKNLKLPILIINGTKDLQVSQAEAKDLKAASNNAQLKIIKNMNHVLFNIEGNDLENSKSYNESFRKLAPNLLETIISFIHTH